MFATRGFSHKEKVVYEKTFGTFTEYTSIKGVMSFVSFKGWRIHQIDVKTTFLNGITKEEVYIKQPHGFEIIGKESHICKFKRALSGLKQVPRAWYSRIDRYLLNMGVTEREADPNLYFIFVGVDLLVLVLCVDNLFLTSSKNLIA